MIRGPRSCGLLEFSRSEGAGAGRAAEKPGRKRPGYLPPLRTRRPTVRQPVDMLAAIDRALPLCLSVLNRSSPGRDVDSAQGELKTPPGSVTYPWLDALGRGHDVDVLSPCWPCGARQGGPPILHHYSAPW